VWDDLSTVYLAAQILGFDKPDRSQLYNLTDDQLTAVRKKLIELKPNIRKIWATVGELNQSLPEPRGGSGHGLAAEHQ